mgnify:CR=1 FL=1
MAYLDHIHACNNFDQRDYLPFVIENERFGWVGSPFASRLAAWPDIFNLSPEHITLAENFKDFDSRSEAVLPPLAELLKKIT